MKIENTKENRVIIVDVDNVLLDWDTGFIQWALTEKGFTFKPNKSLKEKCFIENMFNEIYSAEQTKELIIEFNNSDHFKDLKPIGRSVDVVSQLVAAGFKFIAVSSCGDSDKISQMRRQQLINIFGQDAFLAVFTIPLFHSKKSVYNLYKDSGYFNIDDSRSNIIDSLDYGLQSILINHHLLEDELDEMLRFDSGKLYYDFSINDNPWAHIYSTIKKSYGIQ